MILQKQPQQQIPSPPLPPPPPPRSNAAIGPTKTHRFDELDLPGGEHVVQHPGRTRPYDAHVKRRDSVPHPWRLARVPDALFDGTHAGDDTHVLP